MEVIMNVVNLEMEMGGYFKKEKKEVIVIEIEEVKIIVKMIYLMNMDKK